MVSFMGHSLSPAWCPEVSITVRLLFDPMTVDSGHDERAARFFFLTRSAWTPPDPRHRVTRLLALHWLTVVVSPRRRSSHFLH
jgi:hypothetical protein